MKKKRFSEEQIVRILREAELAAKHYGNARPGIEEMPWGNKEMSVADPFGNRLIFMSTVDAETEIKKI